MVIILLRKWCHNNKHFSDLAPRHGGKTAEIDMVWRNYVTVTLCIWKNKLKLVHRPFTGHTLTFSTQRKGTGQSAHCHAPFSVPNVTLHPPVYRSPYCCVPVFFLPADYACQRPQRMNDCFSPIKWNIPTYTYYFVCLLRTWQKRGIWASQKKTN